MPREWLVERIKDWLTDIERPHCRPVISRRISPRSRAAIVALAVGCVSPPPNFCCSPYRHAGIDEKIINPAERVGFASQLGMHHGIESNLEWHPAYEETSSIRPDIRSSSAPEVERKRLSPASCQLA